MPITRSSSATRARRRERGVGGIRALGEHESSWPSARRLRPSDAQHRRARRRPRAPCPACSPASGMARASRHAVARDSWGPYRSQNWTLEPRVLMGRLGVLQCERGAPRTRRSSTASGGRVLVVDDDALFRRALERISRGRGFTVACAGDPARRSSRLESAGPSTSSSPTCACPAIAASSSSAACARFDPRPALHRVTGYGTSRAFDRRARRGRVLVPAEELRVTSRRRRHWSSRRSSTTGCAPRTACSRTSSVRATASTTWWARASRCATVLDLVDKVADTDATVLDHRRERHRQGAGRARDPLQRPRADRPFVALNCGAIPEEPARERALRPRARAPSPARSHRDGRFAAAERRHALPRRDRRHEPATSR